MHIRCWGSRGSIPVSGKQYIKYGGDTTCVEIRSKKGDLIIIDAGTGIRSLGNTLVDEDIPHIDMLFTHAHWDHLMGFPFFKLLYKKGISLAIYGPPFKKSSPQKIFEILMSRPYFPVQLEDKDIRATLAFKKIPARTFSIGTINIRAIPLSHPKDGGFGFKLEEDGKTFVFLTDNELGFVHRGGCTFDEYCAFAKGADLLIHDAEYEQNEYQKILQTSEEPWGHSVVSDVLDLGIKAGVKQLGLFHLNAMRTDEAVDAIVSKANDTLAKKQKNIHCFAVGSSFETTL